MFRILFPPQSLTLTHTHVQASTAGSRGDSETEKKYNNISKLLTVGAIVFQVVGFIVLVGTIAGVVSSSARTVTRCTSSFFVANC